MAAPRRALLALLENGGAGAIEERCAPRLGLGGECRYDDDGESGLFCDGERCRERICA